MIKLPELKLFVLAAFLACASMAAAQLPNEKFGKPSNMEWDFAGWGKAVNADAIILCKTMKVTYKITDQTTSYNRSDNDVSIDVLGDFGKNMIDEGNILANYEIRLRTKILKPDGARCANIDITCFNADNNLNINHDELSDMKITVFSKNEKGKVEKRKINVKDFTKERIDSNYEVIHVTVPDVQAGNIIEYQYNITSIRPHFIYDWLFQESIPTVHSKCDIDIPAMLQFNMNVPINKLIKSNVKAGRLAYDTNRSDFKRDNSCVTNHYEIVGDYILPDEEEIAPFTSRINLPNVTLPAFMPEGYTHLKILNK